MRRPRRAIHIPLALAFAALAVSLSAWAWGDWRGLFGHPARAGLIIVRGGCMVAALFSGAGGMSSGKREDTRNRWVLLPLTLLWLAMIWLPPYCDPRNLWTLDGDAVRYAGLGLFLLGGVLRVGAVYSLAHRFSGLVAIQEDHQLMTGGLYKMIRHPGYLGMLLLFLGNALVFRSGLGLVITLLLLVPLIARVDAEEALLASEFGNQYSAYRERTWRLVPFVY